MRVVVDPPEMQLAVLVRDRCFRGSFSSRGCRRCRRDRSPRWCAAGRPRRNAGGSSPAPRPRFARGNSAFLAARKAGLLRPGIVAGDFIDPPALDPVVVVGPQQHLGLHVPFGDQAVVPLGRVAVLAAGDEGGPFLDQGFQRFGAEELQEHLPPVAVADGQPVLAQPGEADLIQTIAPRWCRAAQSGSPRGTRLRPNGSSCVVRKAKRAERSEGTVMPGNDLDIDAALVHQDLADGIVVVGPTELEAVGAESPGCPFGARVRLVLGWRHGCRAPWPRRPPPRNG